MNKVRDNKGKRLHAPFCKVINSLFFALKGLARLIRYERNARIHLLATVVVTICGLLFKIEPVEWALIAVVVGMVFLSELFNTAIENIADIVSPEWNAKIEIIKDYSAAAVLVSALVALVVGAVVFMPRILKFIEMGFNL